MRPSKPAFLDLQPHLGVCLARQENKGMDEHF